MSKNLFLNTKGKFFSVTFIKKDGTTRKLNGRLGVKKFLVGGENRLKSHANYLTVWDRQNHGYRAVNLDTIKNFKCGELSFSYEK